MVHRNMQQPESEKGQSFVELAISLVFILVLLGGVVDLGRVLFTFIALRDAAQEGAAYASFCPFDTSGIDVRVRTASTRPVDLLNTTDITVASACEVVAECNAGEGVTVTVASPNFRMSMPFMGGANIPLSSSVTDSVLTNALTCPP